MSDHLTRYEILAFVEGVVESYDNEKMWAHIADCDQCFALYDEVSQAMLPSLRDGEVLQHVDDDGFDAEFADTLQGIEDHAANGDRDARAADALFVQLAQHPVDKWPHIIGANPLVCTAALVQRLINAATPELDRKPDHALVLLQVAEMVAFTLDERTSLRARGDVWKQRSNAYRMAARYVEAIDAAHTAEQLYGEMRAPDSDFEIGQARYTMAAALTKTTRFPAALGVLRSARTLLDQYGESAPLAKVIMLETSIRLVQGDVDVRSAREALRELVPVWERLGKELEVGRARYNIAECNLRLGELDAALDDLNVAIDIFRTHANEAELARCEWTSVIIRLAKRETSAMRDLEPIAAKYLELGMPGEAGFVALDLTESLIQHERWAEAEPLARSLATLFTEAGVTLASVNALHFLRTAIENREATSATVQYIRAYITADDPAQPFAPPLVKPS